MTNFLNKFKIPTILGLGIIVLGLISGLYLVLTEQTFISKASPDLTPQNITITNITDTSVVISWQTNSATVSFVTYGLNNDKEHTVLDDRDTNTPKPYITHYVTLKNLLPQTTYQFKIISNKISSKIQTFETAKPNSNQLGYLPIIGTVLNGDIPINDGIVYLIINGATLQSSLIKNGGNYLIPLSQVRTANLDNIFSLTEDTIAKITVSSNKGSANMVIKLNPNLAPLNPLRIGQNIDLSASPTSQPPNPNIQNLDKFDLNEDGKINATDNAIILLNINKSGSKPNNTKADINQDGKVDKEDLDLMSEKLKELGL